MTTLTNSIEKTSAAPASPNERPAAERTADKRDVDKFEGALQDSTAKPDKKAYQQGNSSAQNELSAIFSSLMGSGNNLPQSTAQTLKTEVPQSGSMQQASLQELADTLVDRILVSDPKFSSGSEVRLLLGQNTGPLNGSEIILRRDLEGMLAVEINCRNKDQFKKYVELRADLTTALERHETGGVNLIINEEPPEDSDFEKALKRSPYQS